MEHLVVDAHSAIHFINTWSDIAQGPTALLPPFVDRTVFRARDPAEPKFSHVEYHIPGPVLIESPQLDSDVAPKTKFSVFKLTRDQLNALKTKCKEGEENGTNYSTVEKVHDSLVRVDDEYMRSALDYLEVQDDLKAHARGGNPFKSPNLGIISWAKLPMYDADFGWGKPVYAGLGVVPSEGGVVVIQSPMNDGELLCAMSMVEEHMNIFEKLLYDI